MNDPASPERAVLETDQTGARDSLEKQALSGRRSPSDIHPLFADRPELDPLAWEMMSTLHSAVPAGERPTGWADFSEAQVLRAKKAAASLFDEAVDRAARRASSSPFVECESRGVMDPETGEVPCSQEDEGGCLCAERYDEAFKAAQRARSLVPLDGRLIPFHPGFERAVAAAALRMRKVVVAIMVKNGALDEDGAAKKAAEPFFPGELELAAAALGVLS